MEIRQKNKANLHEVVKAFGRAVRSLAQPGIVWHLIWPTLVSLAVWLVIAFYFWDEASVWIVRLFQDLPGPQAWFGREQTGSAVATAAVKVFLWLLLVPLVYASALLIVATVALPLMLERVAGREYADLEMRKGGTIGGSIANASIATLVFLVGGLLTLPLWLIPGMAVVLPLLLSAYLNQRAYRYDALMQHADGDEMRRLVALERRELYFVGIGAGLLAYVPFLNLLAPAFAGLTFVHYCLEALRRHRRAQWKAM